MKQWYDSGQRMELSGFPIFFQKKGTGEALLCIHGFPSSSWDFAWIVPELQKHFTIIVPDLIGLGKSAKPHEKITIRLQADVLEELMMKLEIKSAHLLAHDLGDTVAQELLARLETGTSKIRWQSCVFLNGGIFPETHQPLLIQKILKSPVGKWLTPFLTKRSLDKNMQRIFSKSHPPSPEFLEHTWELITYDRGKQMIPRLIKYMDERKINRERWISPLVNKIIPMALINGVDDPISGIHAANRYQELIPDAVIILLKNCGHYPHVECPQKTLNAFLKFHDLLPSEGA